METKGKKKRTNYKIWSIYIIFSMLIKYFLIKEVNFFYINNHYWVNFVFNILAWFFLFKPKSLYQKKKKILAPPLIKWLLVL